MRLAWLLLAAAVVGLASACGGTSDGARRGSVAAPSTLPLLATTPEPHSVTQFPCPPHPVTTVDLESCLGRRVLKLNAVVNERIKAVWYFSDAPARRYLVKAEQAWGTHVRNWCTSVSGTYPTPRLPHQHTGGTSAPVEFAECQARLTEAHIRELTRQLVVRCTEGGGPAGPSPCTKYVRR
jgi:uncharacterized protein YecT (DUF1311 family)